MEHNIVVDRNQTYKPSGKLTTIAGGIAIVGLILTAIGLFLTKDGQGQSRFWSSFIFNDLFFTWIAICAGFFITAFRLGYSGWHTLIQRIPEAIGHFMFVGLPLVLVAFIFGKGYLYEWTHADIVAHDGFLQEKSWWLNTPTFIGFTLFWIVTVSWAFYRFRKNSVDLDTNGSYKIFNKSYVLAAIFLFFFAVMNSVSTWHWVMSVEPHWYSTLYAWYLFASALVCFVAFTIIILVLLKRAGYLPQVNINHFHDFGKFLFAFSIFWTYLWFSQYMLIWYANIPEETVHFKYILENHGFVFYLTLFLNFVVPLILLMSRDAKRNLSKLLLVSVIVIVGHWMDFFMMFRPGTEKLLTHLQHMKHEGGHEETVSHVAEKASHGAGHAAEAVGHGAEHASHIVMGIGLTEIGLGAIFLGAFIFVVSWALSKANLVPLNNPFEQESIEHHI